MFKLTGIIYPTEWRVLSFFCGKNAEKRPKNAESLIINKLKLKIMERSTVSSCHSLKIIPIAKLSRFARYGSQVVMLVLGEATDAEAVPGTVKVSTSTENGIIKKKLTFNRADVSPLTSDELERYKTARLVATYVDESGRLRVAGSPSFPLSLDYIYQGGVYAVTLQGEDVAPDAFVAD